MDADETRESGAHDHVALDDADEHVETHDQPERERHHLGEGLRDPLEGIVEEVGDGAAVGAEVEEEAG